MKGQLKRFVNHKGKAYDTNVRLKQKNEANIGFLQMWRYASPAEVAVTLVGVVLGALSSFGTIGGIVVYGELTALFVARHKGATELNGDEHVLRTFGGARTITSSNHEAHMDALVEDSVAFAFASLAIIVLHMAIAAAAVNLVGWAAARMVTRLRVRLLRSVISQEIAFFDTNTTLNFASTLTQDMEKFRGGVGEHVAMTANLAGTVALGAALALTYGWELTLAGLAVVPVSIAVAMLVAKNQTKCTSEEVKAYGTAGRVVEEALNYIHTVRAYGGEEEEVSRYVEALGTGTPASRRRGLWAGAGAGLGWLLTYALSAIVFMYGAVLCVRDMDLSPEEQQYHPGILVTVLFLTSIAAQNVAMCQPHLEVFSSARGAAKSLFSLLERAPEVTALGGGGHRPEGYRGDIRFENLYFNYPSRPDVKVLRGLTLQVKAGETVALVGSSGCGKSTLLQLLQRLYEPETGSITVDGHRLQDIDLHHFRKSIGVVGQEPVLFTGTVSDNITFGVDGVSHEEVVAAAKLANAHHFIMKLANGYNTLLGSGGCQLSGGQKQRVAIARAVLRRPAILLLDEPTSALDPKAERLVQAALDAASVGRTTLVVSHRLSTIVNATRIVYMEQGSVLEQGTHQELMEKKGAYWKLVQEDMSHKTVIPEDCQEEDDEVPPEPFVRSFSRVSNVRESATSFQRSSWRLSATGGRIPSLTTENVPVVESEDSDSDDQPVPEVSSLALLKLNAKEWPLLVGGALASLVVGAVMPMFAVLFSWLYGMFALSDKEEILSQAQLYAGLFAGIAALCGLFTFLQTWLFNLAGAKLTDRLREITFRNYLQQEQGWFDQASNSVGALCARLATDAAAVQGAAGTRLGTLLQGASTMVIGVALAMVYSWKMTLVSLLSVPFVMGGIILEGHVNRRAEARERAALEQAARLATEALSNVRTVHALGVEETILSRYTASLHDALHQTRWSRVVRGPVFGLCACSPTLGYALSLAYGGYLIARQGLPYQHAILVSEALIYGAWMLAAALAFAPSFAAAKRSGARVVAALQRTPAVVTEPTADADQEWSASGEVQYKNIHFSYPSRPDAPVLRGVTLRVRAGQTMALVGPSGCGKSTLLQLLLRSYDPESGEIELDDKEIKRHLSLPQLRAQLGLVSQEPAVFTRSVRDNIAYGAGGAGGAGCAGGGAGAAMEDVIAAARQANVHQFIASLPMGYDTVLSGGKGASLSGGQKQRLGVARALLRRPRLLLLDEPTSALDASSEKVVQAALDAASEGRTTIIIAHRLATIQHADLICVIDKGVVAETGRHEELLRKQGLYWELWRQQAS